MCGVLCNNYNFQLLIVYTIIGCTQINLNKSIKKSNVNYNSTENWVDQVLNLFYEIINFSYK